VFDWTEVWQPEVFWCSLILFFSAILCSAAGIGGGGIYVAVLMVSGRLSPHNAVPLSKAIVFFGSIASLVVNLFHATKKSGAGAGKVVIDTDACRLVVPATLIGTFLGVLLNRHTSDYLIVVLLTALLGLMTGMVARTARKQAIEENEQDAITFPPAASSSTEPAGAAGVQGDGQANEGTPLLGQASSSQPEQEESVMSMPTVPVARKVVPTKADAGMGVSLLFIVIAGGILRYHMHMCRQEVLGDAGHQGACTHPVLILFHSHMQHWMSNPTTAMIMQQMVWSLPIWTCVAITVHFGFVANRENGWRPRSVMMYQVVSIVTGVLAGLVGVGGGLILSPFFLLTGMDPAVAVGTSATCVLFTSSSTTMQYIFTDRIMMSLALVYGVVCCVASFMGTALVHHIQDKFSRKSYITTIVAIGVAISAMLSVVKFVYLVANPKVEGEEAKVAHFF
jgi:uncharacterized membrane protein YfcA